MTFAIVLFGWIFSFACMNSRMPLWRIMVVTIPSVKRAISPLILSNIRIPYFRSSCPLLFLVMGGIGLPGGAVYIERWRIRNRFLLSAVSLAGPLANLLVAIVLGLILRFFPGINPSLLPGLSFLLVLQVSAVLFNLDPTPTF